MSSTNINHLIRNCSWKYRCTKNWDSLEKSDSYVFERVRYCPDCKENVQLVEDEASLLLAIEQNACVAIPFDITNVKKQLDMPLVGSMKFSLKK